MEKEATIANAIRGLSMDCVQKANSGHPGAPLGMADMAAVLWNRHLNVNPANPQWINRDRFILSNGHASAMLYSLLHLMGFDLSMQDLKNFRQLNSRTPGHPEYRETPGVETTTGPLGQGMANAVGFALAEAVLAEQFNRINHQIIDHYTYCFVGDGCLMEGVASEACSLAGTLGLGKLIVLYDSNGISIDGKIEPWFSENVAQRFLAYGWQVIDHIDGHNLEDIDNAINKAKENSEQPSLIICKTIIGYGSAKLAGSEKSHGAPFGEEEVLATKLALGLPTEPFSLPEDVYKAIELKKRGAELEANWNEKFNLYQETYPELASELLRRINHRLPHDFDSFVEENLAQIQLNAEKIATRKASENSINIFSQKLPELFGASADLTGSNLTAAKTSLKVTKSKFAGNYLSYGVREFAMSAMMNGMMIHGGFLPFGGTFLVFSDYMRNGIRMSALMKLPVIYVFTHDSIGLGEDGPTHQPIEHIPSLRLIPNLQTWRPCDAVETFVAWSIAIRNRENPCALVLSRQNLPTIARNDTQLANIKRGAYVLREVSDALLTLVATGSEVDLALQAAEILASEHISARVVSMPCVEIFKQQDESYKHEVLIGETIIMSIEASASGLWYELADYAIGIDEFGSSAPAKDLFDKYGFTAEKIVEKIKEFL